MALPYNAARFLNVEMQQQSQNALKIQQAHIVLNQPEKGKKSLNEALLERKLLHSQQRDILRLLSINIHDSALIQKHVQLSLAVLKLDNKINQLVSDYNIILADAELALHELQQTDATNLIHKIADARNEMLQMTPSQSVSALNTAITKMFQTRSINSQRLHEALTKYDNITNVSAFEHADLQTYVSIYKAKLDSIHQYLKQLQNNLPHAEWTKFRTITLPSATDTSSQDVARQAAVDLFHKLTTAVEHVQSIPPDVVALLQEPVVTSNWTSQLQWLFWATIVHEQIVFSLEQQRMYSMYMSTLLSRRALGVSIDQDLLTKCQDRIRTLSQFKFPGHNQRPDFANMWNAMIKETVTALSVNDANALKRALRSVHTALSSLLPREPCIEEAQQLLEVFLACTTCVSFNSPLTKTCNMIISDLSNELQNLESKVNSAIQQLKCDSSNDVCAELKTTMFQNHGMQIAFLKHSLKILNQDVLQALEKQHEDLRLHFPALISHQSSQNGPQGTQGHSQGANPTQIVDAELTLAKDTLLARFQQVSHDLFKIYAWYHGAKTFPLISDNNFPLTAVAHFSDFIGDNDLVGKTPAQIESFIETYIPMLPNPDLNTLMTTKDPQLQIALDKFRPNDMMTIVEQQKADILIAQNLLETLKLKVQTATNVNEVKSIETSVDVIGATNSLNAISTSWNSLLGDIVVVASQYEAEIVAKVMNVAFDLVQQFPRRPKKLAFCKVKLETDLVLHTSVERENFQNLCQSITLASCLDDLKRATECPDFKAMVDAYHTSEHKNTGMELNSQFVTLKPQAMLLQNDIEALETEANTQETSLRLQFANPPIYDNTEDSEELAKKSKALVKQAKEKLTELQGVLASIATKENALKIILSTIDGLFPAENIIIRINAEAQELKTNKVPFIWAIANILKTSTFYPDDQFPLVYYHELTQMAVMCALKPTRDDLKQCVEDFEARRDKSAPDLQTFIQNAGITNTQLAFPNIAMQMNDLVTKHLLNLDRIIAMPLTTTGTIEIQKAQDELKDMKSLFDELTKTFQKDILADALTQNTKVLNQIINQESKLATTRIQLFPFGETKEACKLDLNVWLPVTRRQQRAAFQNNCTDYYDPLDEHCAKEKLDGTDMSTCKDIENLIRTLERSKKDDTISSEPAYVALLPTILQLQSDFEAKKALFREAEHKLSNFWKGKLATRSEIDVNEADILKVIGNSNLLLKEHRERVAAAKNLQTNRDALWSDVVDLEKKISEAQDKIDMLRITQYEIVQPYHFQVTNCEREIPFSENYEPTTRTIMINKCEATCEGKPAADFDQCVDAEVVVPLGKSSEIAGNPHIKTVVDALNRSLQQEIKHDDALKRLVDESLIQWNTLKSKLTDINTIQTTDILKAQDLKQRRREEQNLLTTAYEKGVEETGDFQATFTRLVNAYNAEFGPKVFTQSLVPKSYFVQKPSQVCMLELKSQLMQNTQAQQQIMFENCEKALEECKVAPQKDVCVHQKLVALPANPFLEKVNVHDIRKVATLAAKVQSDALILIENEMETSYSNWQSELDKNNDPQNDVELKTLGEIFLLKQTEYINTRTNMLTAQTILDLELMKPPETIVHMLNCFHQFDLDSTEINKIEWSIPSRYTLIVATCQPITNGNKLVKERYRVLLKEAHKVDISTNPLNLLQQLQDALHTLTRVYNDWRLLWNDLKVKKAEIEDKITMLVATKPKTVAEVIQHETEIRTKLKQMLMDTQKMKTTIMTYEDEFQTALDALVTKPKNLSNIYAMYQDVICNNKVLKKFKRKYNNILQLISEMSKYPITETHDAAAILSFLKNPKAHNGAALYLLEKGPFQSTSVAKLNATFLEMVSILLQIDQFLASFDPVLLPLENFDSLAVVQDETLLTTHLRYLQNPNLFTLFDTIITQITKFKANIKLLKTQNATFLLNYEFNIIANVDDIDFKQMCINQGCKPEPPKTCKKFELYAAKLSAHYQAMKATLISQEQKIWFKESQQKRVPLELAFYALLPVKQMTMTAIFFELKEFFGKHDIDTFRIPDTLQNDPAKLQSEVENWINLTTRAQSIYQFFTLLTNLEVLLIRQQAMEADSTHSVMFQKQIEMDEKCAENIFDMIENPDIYKKLKKVIANDYNSSSTFDFGGPVCSTETTTKIVLELHNTYHIYELQLAAIKQKFLQIFPLVPQSLVDLKVASLQISTPVLRSALDVFVQDLSDFTIEIQKSNIIELDVLNESLLKTLQEEGERKYVRASDFMPHVDNLKHSLDFVKVVLESYQNSVLATSTFTDPSRIEFCKRFFTQQHGDPQVMEKMERTIYVFWKLLKTSDPNNIDFLLKHVDADLPTLLTCPSAVSPTNLWKVEQTKEPFRLGTQIDSLSKLFSWVSDNSSANFPPFKGILIIDPAGSMFTTQKFEGGGFSGGLYALLNISGQVHSFTASKHEIVFNANNATLPTTLSNFNTDLTGPLIYVLHVNTPEVPTTALEMPLFRANLEKTIENVFTAIVTRMSEFEDFVIVFPLLSSGILAARSLIAKEPANQDLYAKHFMKAIVTQTVHLAKKGIVIIPHPPPSTDPAVYVPDYAKALHDATPSPP